MIFCHTTYRTEIRYRKNSYRTEKFDIEKICTVPWISIYRISVYRNFDNLSNACRYYTILKNLRFTNPSSRNSVIYNEQVDVYTMNY